MNRSRGGLTNKIHAMVDSNGLPVRLALTADEAHASRLATKLLSRLKSGAMLLGDRGHYAARGQPYQDTGLSLFKPLRFLGGRSIIGPSRARVMQAADRTNVDKARHLLGECILFRGLSADERSDLVTHARIRIYAAGETIFLMGSSGDSMMAVLDGNIRISVPSPEGKEIALAIIQPGEVFGEIAVLDGKERTAEATAMTDCTLAVLERRDVLSFLKAHPNCWPPLVDLLCARLRHSDRQIAEMAFLQLPVRLAKALLRMADMAAGLAGARAGARIRLTQRELGNIVGMTRESVNKCLREWQRAGIVRIEANAILIVKREALEQVASPD